MTATSDLQVLPDILRLGEGRFADAVALSSLSQPQSSLSYARLAARARNGAARLAAQGLTPGARVVLLFEGRPDCAAALFAILEAGLVAVPLLPDTPSEAVACLARKIGAAAVVSSERLEEPAANLRRLSVKELLEPIDRPVETGRAKPEDLALLAFTSGTTRGAKAVALSHANLIGNLRAALSLRRAEPGDALLSMLPPAHLFELVTGLFCPLSCGARVVYAGAQPPNRLVAALAAERITHALVVPALLELLLREGLDGRLDAAGDLHDLPPARLRAAFRQRVSESFGTLICGGGALDPAWSPVCTALGLDLDVGYGLTEAGPMVALGRSGACPPGSVGRPLPGVEVRLGARQEILIRGPGVMQGYAGDPAATAEALAGGWLHSGDTGRLDDDGFLYVTGRLKEAMVTAAGLTLYPDEVEPHYRDPLFAEVCAVPFRGPQGNDIPILVVVPALSEVSDAEVERTFRRLRAAAPSRFRLTAVRRLTGRLPRTPLGKIRRRDLARHLERREETA
jgi:long-chain acyl-CoA synthetase